MVISKIWDLLQTKCVLSICTRKWISIRGTILMEMLLTFKSSFTISRFIWASMISSASWPLGRWVKTNLVRILADVNWRYHQSLSHINSFSDNIALYKPAMQSSTYVWDGCDVIAAWAVDGNADPVFENYHCSCTHKTYEPWWAVDLGSRYTVLKVCLTNRQNPIYGKGNGKAIPPESRSWNINWHVYI